MSLIVDIQELFSPSVETKNTNPNKSDNDHDDHKTAVVSRAEVLSLAQRILTAYPDMKDVSFLGQTGFTYRAQLLIERKLNGKSITADGITDLIFPFLDEEAWHDMSRPLIDIVNNPGENPFSLENVCNKSSPWW